MKKLVLLLCILSSQYSISQIVINQNHMPKSGDTLRFSIGLPDSVLLSSFENGGSNLTWDYSDMIPVRQGVRSFFNSAETPYNNFVTDRIGEVLADTLTFGGFSVFDVFDFFNSDSSAFALDHRGITAPTGLQFPLPTSISVAPEFEDVDEIYQFPLEYLDEDSSTFKVIFDDPTFGVYYESSGERINSVDAWGTLTTPYGTFSTIRVVSDIFSLDTVSFSGTNVGIESHQREYKWLSTESAIPALIISGPVVEDVFAPTNIQFRDSVRDIPAILAPTALFIADELEPELGETVNFSNLSVSLLSFSSEWEISPSTFSFVNGTSGTSDSIAVVFNDTGFYDVRLTVTNSEGSDELLIEDFIRVNPIITGLNNIGSSRKSIKIFPNPIGKNEALKIISKGELIKDIELINSNGRTIRRLNDLNHRKVTIPSPSVKGLYFLKVSTNKGIALKKLILK